MREISLHLLDIAENSVAAGAGEISIAVSENSLDDLLSLSVEDDGRGMDSQTVQQVIDPFYTSRTTRKVGLGIPLLKAAAEACGGMLEIFSEPGKGTRLTVVFQLSHIDRMPLGDLQTTLLNLLIAYPHIHWVFDCRKDGESFFFDSQALIDELAGIPFSEPVVLRFLKDLIDQGLAPLDLDSQTTVFMPTR